MAEKFPAKTKPAIAKNTLAVSFLVLRELMQVDAILHEQELTLAKVTKSRLGWRYKALRDSKVLSPLLYVLPIGEDYWPKRRVFGSSSYLWLAKLQKQN